MCLKIDTKHPYVTTWEIEPCLAGEKEVGNIVVFIWGPHLKHFAGFKRNALRVIVLIATS